MRVIRVAALAVLGLVAVGAVAQQANTWTVKPAWVLAHEQFLASDAMQGRGSATHDEEVTATYVASEFVGYGLKTAPGMTGYLQSAEIVSPVLDGHGSISAGSLSLSEGAEFQVLISSGSSVSGPLLKMKAGEIKNLSGAKGAVVVITDVPAGFASMGIAQQLRRSGAAMIVVEESEASTTVLTQFGGKTRVPIRLKESPAPRSGLTMVAVSSDAYKKLTAEASGETVSLTLHEVPNAKPRMTYNAIGYLPGSDPKAGTILLTAHLDHLGIGRPVNGDAIFNGANDDAAGTTAVLELAHALASGPQLKRSVLFVCYGSEEAGELGRLILGSILRCR